jgi:hypothetical protein
VVSLAELCNRNYLTKQRKGGKSDSSGNIFPASMSTSGKSKNGQQIPQPSAKPVHNSNIDQTYYSFIFFILCMTCFLGRKVRE